MEQIVVVMLMWALTKKEALHTQSNCNGYIQWQLRELPQIEVAKVGVVGAPGWGGGRKSETASKGHVFCWASPRDFCPLRVVFSSVDINAKNGSEELNLVAKFWNLFCACFLTLDEQTRMQISLALNEDAWKLITEKYICCCIGNCIFQQDRRRGTEQRKLLLQMTETH